MTHVRKLLLNTPELIYICVCVCVYVLYLYGGGRNAGLMFSARVRKYILYTRLIFGLVDKRCGYIRITPIYFYTGKKYKRIKCKAGGAQPILIICSPLNR